MSRDLSTYSPEFQGFVRSICAEFASIEGDRSSSLRTEAEHLAIGADSSSAPPEFKLIPSINPHAVCACGHELHRHHIFPGTVCEGAPVFPELRGKCDCKGFEFPQHPAEAAEREESVSTVVEHGPKLRKAAGSVQVDVAGRGRPVPEPNEGAHSVSRTLASEYPISPADSSFVPDLFNSLMCAGGML